MTEHKWSKVEEPTESEETGPSGGTRIEHPSFATISAGRVSGSTNLFGSEFRHHNYISIKINKACMFRSLSRDWPFAREEIIEVNMSEAQWATFISSLNTSGTRCTLRHVNCKPVPRLPEPKQKSKVYDKEANETVMRALTEMKDLKEAINQLSISNTKKHEIFQKINSASSAITSSAQFILEQFKEYTEDTVEAAKIEVEAYISQSLRRAGLNVEPEKVIQITMESKNVG